MKEVFLVTFLILNEHVGSQSGPYTHKSRSVDKHQSISSKVASPHIHLAIKKLQTNSLQAMLTTLENAIRRKRQGAHMNNNYVRYKHTPVWKCVMCIMKETLSCEAYATKHWWAFQNQMRIDESVRI